MKKNLTIKNYQFTQNTKSFLIAFGLLLLLLGAILWPLASIWAINTLFKCTIEYTFWNWLACWILIATFQGAITVSRKRNN